MNEGRVVLCVFGVIALILIALPVSAIWTRTAATAPDQALDGALSQVFLAQAPRGADVPGKGGHPVGGIDAVLPLGSTQRDAFAKLAASGFACEPDANSAACYRPYKDAAGCPVEWRVRMTFDGAGQLSARDALSTTTCP